MKKNGNKETKQRKTKDIIDALDENNIDAKNIQDDFLNWAPLNLLAGK